MKSNSVRVAVVLIVVIVIGVFLLFPRELPPAGEILQADDSTRIEEEPEWETRLTTVYINDWEIYFGGGDQEPHMLLFFPYNWFEGGVAEIAVDHNYYYFVLNPYQDRFDVFSEGDAFLGSHSFTPGKVSAEPISFGEYPVEYYYYISKDGNYLFLLLAAQEFNLQFGKNFWFEGTDSLDDGEIDREYFYPGVGEFGYTGRVPRTAVFSFDQDEDHEADARIFIDTETLVLIDPETRDSYEWRVVFKHGNNWYGYNPGDDELLRQNSFGSVISTRWRSFYFKMPDDEKPVEE